MSSSCACMARQDDIPHAFTTPCHSTLGLSTRFTLFHHSFLVPVSISFVVVLDKYRSLQVEASPQASSPSSVLAGVWRSTLDTSARLVFSCRSVSFVYTPHAQNVYADRVDFAGPENAPDTYHTAAHQLIMDVVHHHFLHLDSEM